MIQKFGTNVTHRERARVRARDKMKGNRLILLINYDFFFCFQRKLYIK